MARHLVLRFSISFSAMTPAGPVTIYLPNTQILCLEMRYKENTQEILGTSICLVRNSDLDKIIPEMGENIKPVDVEKLVEAQKNVGVVDRKNLC